MKCVAAEDEGYTGPQRGQSAPTRPEGRFADPDRLVRPLTAAGSNDFGPSDGAENACRGLDARENGQRIACGGRRPRLSGKSRPIGSSLRDKIR